MKYFLEFSDQAWDAFSVDLEKAGGTSQYVLYIINKYRKEVSAQSVPEEKVSHVGNAVISYEISSDRIRIMSIVDENDGSVTCEAQGSEDDIA